MARVTIKSLQQEIQQLKSVNEYYMTENNKLNAEIESFKDKNSIVSREEYEILVRQLEKQHMMTNEYKKLYEDLKNKQTKDRDKLIDKINELQQEINRSEIKLNERGAGRKAYSNQDVIKRIYTLYLEGYSLQKIVNELNRTEIKTARGKAWAKSSIRFILKNHKNVENGYIEESVYNTVVDRLSKKNK